MNETDPNKQQHHTFGSSKAAERLKREIDKGANYKSAVRIMNKGMAFSNDLAYAKLHDRAYFLYILREDILRKIDSCSSDPIVKSLCKNVFTTKYRFMLKLLKSLDLAPVRLRQLGSAHPEEKSGRVELHGWRLHIRNLINGLLGGDPSK